MFEKDKENKQPHLVGFDEWLNATSQRDPDLALAATEIYLAYVSRAKPFFYDHKNRLVQLMTKLFAEAEEREESDNGAMLERVVAVQDLMLSFWVTSINDWLKAAERHRSCMVMNGTNRHSIPDCVDSLILIRWCSTHATRRSFS